MELQKLVEELDNMVVSGKVIEAFDKFFHDDCITHYSRTDKSTNKAEKMARLRHFYDSVIQTDAVVLHHSAVGDNVSMSEMTFEYTFKDGSSLRWNEILRRIWQEDKVIDERYYIGEDIDVVNKAAKTVKPKKTVTKKTAPKKVVATKK